MLDRGIGGIGVELDFGNGSDEGWGSEVDDRVIEQGIFGKKGGAELDLIFLACGPVCFGVKDETGVAGPRPDAFAIGGEGDTGGDEGVVGGV